MFVCSRILNIYGRLIIRAFKLFLYHKKKILNKIFFYSEFKKFTDISTICPAK